MKKFLLSMIAILIIICTYQVGVSYGSPKGISGTASYSDYIIVSSANDVGLVKEVTKKMRKDNYTPIGGPYVQGEFVYQAMAR